MVNDLERKILVSTFKNLKYSIREIINPENKITEYDIFLKPEDIKVLEKNLINLENRVFKIKRILLPKKQYQYFIEIIPNEKYLILDIHCYLPLHRKNWLAPAGALDVIINNSFLENELYFIDNNMFKTILLVKALIYLKFPINKEHKLKLEKEVVNYKNELIGQYDNLILDYLPIKHDIINLCIKKIVNEENYDSILLNSLNAPTFLSLKLNYDRVLKKFVIPLFLKRKQLTCTESLSKAIEKYSRLGFNVIVTNKRNLKYYLRTFTGISILAEQETCNFNMIFDSIKDKYMLELK